MKIAVYGTLKRGFHNHYVMRSALGIFLEEKKISGLRIFNVDQLGYPIAVLDPASEAFVELFEVDPSRVRILDHLEGYDKNDRENSLYIRTYIPETDIQVYVIQDISRYQGRLTKVEEWR